jgi:hypothetical protein
MAEFEFKVAPSAQDMIGDISFDSEGFARYLTHRGVPEEETEQLELRIDEDEMMFRSIGIYSPRDTEVPGDKHLIALSPRRMPRSFRKQGALLRHETEHFIYQVRHPQHVRNRSLLLGTVGIAGAALGGIRGIEISPQITHGLPPLEALPADAGITVASTAFFALGTIACVGLSGKIIGPSELQAVWAGHMRRRELPDNTLRVEVT